MVSNLDKKSSVNIHEVEKFSNLADGWWDENGPFKTLHEINPIRLEYICSKIRNYYGDDLSVLEILDAGCGGGIISIPLARLGAKVTGIDAGKANIEAAKTHAKKKGIKIDFLCTNIEEHKKQYDVLLCLEVIEHVDNLEEFMESLASLLKPGGLIILSTINRTIKAYLLAIGAAEYILNWVPRGTHDFKKFVKPSELTNIIENNNINLSDISGMSYNIITKSWKLSDDVDVNYFISGVKSKK